MNYHYDPEADSLYVQVSSAAVQGQVERADGVIVDVDAVGRPVGFDVMNPGAGWDVETIVAEYGFDGADAELLRALGEAQWQPASAPIADAPARVQAPVVVA
jgi:uncharacterized protein YuzE